MTLNKKTKKFFELSDKAIDILERVKKEKNIKTDVKALEYILQSYDDGQVENKEQYAEQISDLVLTKIQKEYYKFFERLRWSTRESEINSTLILDAINTELIKNKVDDCIPISVIESPVIKMSREIYKKKIDYFKQKKEDRKLKQGLK